MNVFAAADFSLQSFFAEIKGALIEMGEDFAQFIPDILLALVLLFLGFVMAKIISKVVSTSFEKLGLDSLLDKGGVTEVLQRAGIKLAPGAFLAKLLFWVAMLFVIKMAANRAQIEDISNIIVAVIHFMPSAITAALIMLVGFIIADVIKNAVFTSLDAAGLDYARTLSKVVFGFIFILVLTVALAKINIQTELLNATVMILLSALGLALAISLGLGFKGLARNVVSGVYSRDIYRVGTQIEYDGETMTISGVGPVTTKLNRADGGFVIVPNERLISEPVWGRSAE